MKLKTIAIFLLIQVATLSAYSQTTEFTYQGSLKDGAFTANGSYDFEFTLYDQASGGIPQSSAIQKLNVSVVNGIFTVSLDFGSGSFPGADRFLDIRVRTTAGGGPGTPLSPRQQVNSAPYSVRSLSAATADIATNASNLGGLPTNGYIQNTLTQQSASNFHISGYGFIDGQLGVGVSNLTAKFAVDGSASGSTEAIFAKNVGIAIKGESTTDDGVFGTSSGVGVRGLSANGTGVKGDTTTNVGVFGAASGSGTGVFGLSNTGTGVYGSSLTGMAGYFQGPANVLGKLGVGFGVVEVPPEKLSVFTATTNYGFLHTDGTVSVGSFVGGTAGGGWYGTKSNHPLSLFAGGSGAALTVTTAGRVGIGTGVPSDKLTVQTATTNYGFTHTDGIVTVGTFVGGSTGGGYFGTKSNHSLSLFTNNAAPSLTIGSDGLVNIPFMATQGGAALCRNGPAVAFCSSSLRYKTNIERFSEGMSFVNRLQPISFDWKKDGEKDVGFGAEEIEKIDPRFVTYNDKGQVEGVKYDRLSVAFVNAFKEQQSQIERQQKQIDALIRLACSQKPEADICKEEN